MESGSSRRTRTPILNEVTNADENDVTASGENEATNVGGKLKKSIPSDRKKEKYQKKTDTERRKIRTMKEDKKRKKHTLSLQIVNFKGTVHEFKEIVQQISKRTLQFISFEMNENETSCKIQFSSSHQLKDVMFAIQSHNRSSAKMKIIAKSEHKSQVSIKSKLSEYLEKMTKEASNALSKHQSLVGVIEERIQGTLQLKKTMSLDELLRKDDEKRALESKLLELKQQKDEFRNYLKCAVDKLEEARGTKKNDTKLKMIYSSFQVECTRLRMALPMYARRTDIMSMVKDNQVSILLGETGSGKSTQVAQYMYQAGLSNKGTIVCTQPRKIAAISLATHVAQEMGSSVGQLVGYRVGMQVRQSHDTKILYMTDHMLLNECLKDKDFSSYSCIIIDEAHERSIYTDLLLGMIKKCINNRPDLRIVITSATIDPKLFVDYFGTSPVLSVTGRMFPVDVIWANDETSNDSYEQTALQKSIEVHNTEEKGDILTFLTSPLEIERCCTAFQEKFKKDNFICLPLHGRLQPNEQQKVFDPTPNGKRKIVFATNSAETSITIPGIKYVIDTGVAKEMQFDPKRNINTLTVTNVTKSSADQRKGRAGRTESGKCFRLYTEEIYDKMEKNARPEILRVHLGHALLKLMELGVEPMAFDFVQAPPRALMDTAMETLEFVGAVEDKKITKLGIWIAKLPIDPKFGSFVHESIKEGVGIEAVILSACCAAGGSMFYRSGTDEEKSKADKLKVRFCHEGGDLMTMLNVYREWHQQPEKSKGTWCAANSINGKAIRGIRETVNEVLNVLQKEQEAKIKFHLHSQHGVDEKLQKMLFKTFIRNICHYLGHEKAGYLVVQKNQLVQLFPASALKSIGILPGWIVLEQVLKTSRDFAVNVTAVPDKWIQEAIERGWLQIDVEDVANRRVESVASFEIGEQVFKNFVGVRYTKLREMENTLKEKNKDKIIIIEAVKALGEVAVYSQNDCQDIYTTVKNSIEPLRQRMKFEKSEQFLSTSNSGVRVVIGAGLTIEDVLMADEYKTVFITVSDIMETVSEEEMVEQFEKFGKIIKVEKFKNNKNRKNWGRLTFETKEAAERAVEKLIGGKGIAVKPSIGFQSSDIGLFRSKLLWCRRPSRGFGFVRFKDQSYADISLQTSIYVGGNVVKIKRSKTGLNEVHVGNLNQNVDENILRQGFAEALVLEGDDIERVTVIRQKVNTSQEQEMLQILKQRLRRKLEEYVQEGTYELDFRSPKEADFTYLAFASFSKPEEGLAACQGIDHSFIMNNEIVNMKPNVKTSLMVPKLVYHNYKTVVEEIIERLSRTEPITIRPKQLKNENMVFDLHSDSFETTVNAKREILRAVKGRMMDMETNSDINKLFSWDGRRFLKVIMNETKTVIVIDDRIISLAIHGQEEHQQIAMDMITKYLNDLVTGESKTLILKGDDKPPGVMKELMLKFEFDLSKLKSETGLKYIELNSRTHTVTIVGDTEAIDKATGLVEKVVQTVIEKNKELKLKETQSRDCVVCFCPIEEFDMYRLEVCGHPHCKGCIDLQFKSAVQNKTFPITCSKEDCEELWAWTDISNLSFKTGLPIAILVHKATSSFVAQNKTSYQYCSTADCPLIYKITEKEKLFKCPECEVRICTACHNQFHDGLTCKMAESLKKDDGGIKLWMEQNASRAKYCPKCSTPIEKIDGCNHMTCRGCQAHICWICLQYFQSGQECYGHMQKAHGTFV